MKRTAIDLNDMPPIKISCSKERLANRLKNVVSAWLKSPKPVDADLVPNSAHIEPDFTFGND